MWRTLTPVQCMANKSLHATQMGAVPISWMDHLPECTRPSFPWLADALHPIVTPQQQQLLQQHPPIAYYPTEGTAWQQPTPPAQFGGMPPASGTYRQQTTMATPVFQPDQGILNFVGQYPPSARNMPIVQMGQQPTAASMMMNYYAPNQPHNQQLEFF